MKTFLERNKPKIITITLMIVIGTAMHFVCDLVGNEDAMKVLGIVFPVNETSWEHMKMLWYPFLVAGIILSRMKKDAGYFGGFMISGVVAMLVIIGLFSFYQSFTGTSILILDIVLFIIVIVLSSMLAYFLAEQKWCKKSWIIWLVCAVAVTAAIIYLTYHPGPGYLFLDDEGLAVEAVLP